MVIAKGQGNFETLSEEAGDIFFLFRGKCPVIANQLGLGIGAHVLTTAAATASAVGGETHAGF